MYRKKSLLFDIVLLVSAYNENEDVVIPVVLDRNLRYGAAIKMYEKYSLKYGNTKTKKIVIQLSEDSIP